MPDFKISSDAAQAAMLDSIQREFRELANEQIEKSVAEFHKQLQSQIGHIVLRLMSQYSIHRDGTDLVIHVKNEVR